MSAVEAYEQIQPPEQEARGAKIIPFPVRPGVGELAVGAFAGSQERENPLDSAVLAGIGIAVHQGSGSNMYITRRKRIPSAAPYSQEYNVRTRELHNR